MRNTTYKVVAVTIQMLSTPCKKEKLRTPFDPVSFNVKSNGEKGRTPPPNPIDPKTLIIGIFQKDQD